MTTEVLEAISASDPSFRTALREAGLPTHDLDEPGRRFFVLRRGNAGVAWGGWEGEGEDRLLRSVVVAPEARGAGLGKRLVAALEAEAHTSGARRLWLLTTDAADFFEAVGWRRAERAEAPAEIRATAQFRTLCPASADGLRRDLAARFADEQLAFGNDVDTSP